MRTTYKLWLATVIVLTVAAFLAVFQPMTFSPRKDPSDTSLYLRPLNVKGKFDATQPPSVNELFSGVKVYFYKPQHDLRLGLDLRGGMRVVLQIPDRAEFHYELHPKLANPSEAGRKQQELAAKLAEKDSLGDLTKDSSKFTLTVSEKEVLVNTIPNDSIDAQHQLEVINKAMEAVFGAQKYVEPNPEKIYVRVNQQTQDTVRNILSARVNPEGTKEVQSYAKGDRQVVLEIPGEKDPERVREQLRATTKLEFRLVPETIQVNNDPVTDRVTITQGGKEIDDAEAINASYLVASGSGLNPDAMHQTMDDRSRPAVAFGFKPGPDSDQFSIITNRYQKQNRQLAIVLDGRIISAPVIEGHITGNGIITGNFTSEQVQDLVNNLKAGSLPVPVEIVENRTVSATLGADSVSASLKAGIIGLLAVLVFMFAYYRLPGLMANLALIIYIFLALGVMWLYPDFTLTLPGIAGIIISIGMAVDANVIIFERLKEELHAQKPVETAIDVAFSRAWTAILDSNVASLITGAVLYAFGTGAVRGFAVALMIGVAVSLFTAVTVTRLFMKLLVRSKIGHKLSWYGI